METIWTIVIVAAVIGFIIGLIKKLIKLSILCGVVAVAWFIISKYDLVNVMSAYLS